MDYALHEFLTCVGNFERDTIATLLGNNVRGCSGMPFSFLKVIYPTIPTKLVEWTSLKLLHVDKSIYILHSTCRLARLNTIDSQSTHVQCAFQCKCMYADTW